MSTVTTVKTETAPVEVQEDQETGGGKKKLLIGVLVLALGAGAGWWFLLRPAAAGEEAPKPGEVLVLDAIQINLADGHYLRLGLALQKTEDASEHVEGSRALDAAIELFTGERMDELAQAKHRNKLKDELEHELGELYHGEVMGVYFTDFVTQ
jgi:flagellar FliL protein